MPQVTIRCPFGELDLCDQLRFKPDTVIHIGSMNRIFAGGNALKALGLTRSVNAAFRVFQRLTCITLSARASTLGGIVRPICFAAFRLMTNSNFLGCSTGRSAGLAPLRILST